MARGAASSILLMLSFLLLVAGISAAAVSGDTDIIRLPTDTRGLADARPAAAAADDKRVTAGDDDEKRPWDCCNLSLCTRSSPPICRCMDKVKECHSNCKYCQEVENSGHKRYMCLDTYHGYPGPTCEEEKQATVAEVVTDDKKATVGDDDEKRPWDCCTLALCTKSQPPICRCMDKVKQCHSNCQYCQELEDSGHKRYICLDPYHGDPGPTCEEEKHAPVTETMVADDKKATTSGGDEKRPWECCNLALCTLSFPPICRCMDKVEQCHSNCQHCQELEDSGQNRYICLDTYIGDPGPRCEEEKRGPTTVAINHRFYLAGKE